MKLFLIAIALFLSNAVGAQGNVDGFFKSKGEIDVALSGSYVYARTYIAGTNNSLSINRDQSIIGAYAVYGVSDKWNAIVSLPMINFQFQDASLFAKYKLMERQNDKGRITMAPALGVSFPMSNYDFSTAQAIGQRAITIQPKYVAQFHHNKNWFIQAQGGYNYSLDPVPSSISASAKIGYMYKSWYFDVWYDYQYGIGGKDYASFNAEPLESFRELGVSYQRVGGVIYTSLGNRIGAFAGMSTVLSGRNMSKAIVGNAGVVLKFKVGKN